MIFNSGTVGMQNRQSDLFKLQNQLSTGRRILSPEDDPIGASEALEVTQSKGVNKQFLDNQANAKTKLNFLDTTLAAVGDELQSIHEREVQAGNGTYSAAQRGMIAAELKQRMGDLIGLANTQDGTGLYIFAGYKTATQPFQVSGTTPPYALGAGTYVSYSGDAGKQSLQVTLSKEIATSENGLDVFMQVKDAAGNVTGRSLFDGLQNMIDILDGTQPYTGAAYTQALGDSQSAIDHIAGVRASVGARLQAVTSLTSTGEDIGFLYDSRLSELQDLDYTAAISQFSQVQMQLEAAQLSFKQSSQLSLFNIL
jgi:flagellar hook-associated protein 3 FlgL